MTKRISACKGACRPLKHAEVLTGILSTFIYVFQRPPQTSKGPALPSFFWMSFKDPWYFNLLLGVVLCAFWRPFTTSQNPKLYLKGLYRPNPLNCVAGVKTLSWFAYLLSQPMLPQFVLTPRAFLVAVGQFRKACGLAKEDSQSHFALRDARGALSRAILLFPGP